MVLQAAQINKMQEILLYGRNPNPVSHTGNLHGVEEDLAGTLSALQLPGLDFCL